MVQSGTQVFEEAGLNSVSAGLKELVNSEMFKCLRAYVNSTKHRSLLITIFAYRYPTPKTLGWLSLLFTSKTAMTEYNSGLLGRSENFWSARWNSSRQL